jgi:hypothetical protein
MSPQVPLEAATIERMKAHAEPLVDTYDTVANRALDALDALKEQTASTTGERVINPASPPNLAYTTVRSVALNGRTFPAGESYWNTLMLAVIREAKKTLSTEQVSNLILSNHVIGKKEHNGYKYLDDVGISVQGQDANNAWRTTYNVLKAIKVPAEVTFVWQDNPKAVAPGSAAKLTVALGLWGGGVMLGGREALSI